MFNHHTKTKVDLGVLKAKVDLFEKGFLVMSPETEHAPFDVVAYKDNEFKRIQVKYRELVKGRIELENRTSWADKNGSHSTAYDLSQIDVFCVFISNINNCFYVSSDLFKGCRTLNFRVEKPKNNYPVRLIGDYSEVP